MTTHNRDKVIAIAEEVKANNDMFGDFSVALYAIAFEAGRQDEREECAKVCESGSILDYDSVATAENCAEAIRARGDTK